EVTVDFGSLQDNWSGVLMDLERVLISQGLYEKEARAMIETWRDSWFEEWTRLFYIVPRQAVDSILPLDIQPAPSDVARVFVGRMEIIGLRFNRTCDKRWRLTIGRRSKSTDGFWMRSRNAPASGVR